VPHRAGAGRLLPVLQPQIFLAMREMFDRETGRGPISLADYLKSQGELERVGGRPTCSSSGNNSLALASWRHHVEILRRDSTLRADHRRRARSRPLPTMPPRTPRRSWIRPRSSSSTSPGLATSSYSYSAADVMERPVHRARRSMCENQTESPGRQDGLPRHRPELWGCVLAR
jgi:replicative DNA helicase